MTLFPTTMNAMNPSVAYRFRQQNDSEYDFDVVLPTGVNPLEYIPQDTEAPLCVLNRFASRDDGLMEVTVSVTHHSREVNPADCLDIEFSRRGWHLLERRKFNSAGGILEDVLVRRDTPDGTRVGRALMVKDANRLFLVHADVLESRYQALADACLLAISSFELINPSDRATAELLRTFDVATQLPFEFRYPESWTHTLLVDGEDLCSLDLATECQGSVAGKIHIEVHRKDSRLGVNRVLREYSDSLRALGMHVQGAAVVPFNNSPMNARAYYYHPAVQYDVNSFESPVFVFETTERIILLAMLGTAREDSPHWWAVNKRAFQIVQDSFRLCDTDQFS